MSYALDVGGSETRVIMDGGETRVWDSDFIIADSKDYQHPDLNDKESVCDIGYNGEHYRMLKGEAMAYSRNVIMTCDNNVFKSDFIGTYLNTLYGIARTALDSGITSVSNVVVGICLPPAEALTGVRTRFIESLCGNSEVIFPLTGRRVNISLEKESIRVFPEGTVSMFAIQDPVIKRRILTSTVLICDIGYRSTDLTVLRNGAPYRGAYDSVMIGGINIEASLKSQLESQSRFFSTEDLRDILISGVSRDGSGELALGAVVRDIKRGFVPRVVNDITRVLNSAGLNLSTVHHFVPIGRPFSQTGMKDSPSDGGCLINMLSDALKIPAIPIEDSRYSNVRGVSNLVEAK